MNYLRKAEMLQRENSPEKCLVLWIISASPQATNCLSRSRQQFTRLEGMYKMEAMIFFLNIE